MTTLTLSKLSVGDKFHFSDSRNKRFNALTEYQVMNKSAFFVQIEKTPVRPDGKIIEIGYDSKYYDQFVTVPFTIDNTFPKSISKKTFTSNINIDNGYNNISIGECESSMELFQYQDGSLGIEWVVNDGEFVEHIGIENEQKRVTGYDGVFEIPMQAVEMLETLGYNCSEVK